MPYKIAQLTAHKFILLMFLFILFTLSACQKSKDMSDFKLPNSLKNLTRFNTRYSFGTQGGTSSDDAITVERIDFYPYFYVDREYNLSYLATEYQGGLTLFTVADDASEFQINESYSSSTTGDVIVLLKAAGDEYHQAAELYFKVSFVDN